MSVIELVLALVRSLVRRRAELAAENRALRQQLAVLREQTKRPRTVPLFGRALTVAAE